MQGIRPINRPGWMGARGRRLRKLVGSKTWFKKKPVKIVKKGWVKKTNSKVVEVKEREIEAVMFVPCTRDSKLQKRLQELDDDFIKGGKDKRIRFIERSGTTLEQLLSKSDPWGGDGCTRDNCFQCQHGGGTGGGMPKRKRAL